MNNELKEILDNIKNKYEDYYVQDIVSGNDLKQLLDYITNLQQENGRLKENRDWWKDRFFGQQEYDDSHRITAIEYRKRIDKAVLFINENNLEDYCNEEKLLNILQNGSEENVSDRD